MCCVDVVVEKSILRVAIYNSLWPDISRFFMIDLIDSRHINLMENVNEEGKHRNWPLVYPGYYLSDEFPDGWMPLAVHKMVVSTNLFFFVL